MKWWALIYIMMFPLIPWGKELAVHAQSPWWTHFTYMWAHAGILHYAANGLCWLMMWKIISPSRTITAIIIASLVPAGTTPTLGWSVILYYYMGLCVAGMSPEARTRLLLLIGVGFLIPWIAAWHHTWMLIAGWIIRKLEVKWFRTIR